MKFKVGDQVLVTSGKDKSKQGKILKVFPETDKVLVEGANMYMKHIKPYAGRPGDRVRKERALSAGKVSILNPDTKKADRIGYSIAKDGSKVRIFKKTGKVI